MSIQLSTETIEQIMMIQIPSASVSLVASSLTAAFIAFGKDPAASNNNTRNGRRRRARRQHQRHPTIHQPANDATSARFQCGTSIQAKFYSPYRRLIFGLSISDICQSFAVLTGPIMVRSDVPQALWGLGNAGTCNINGFLFLVGMTAVPMYTLCLCIYYICKIKGKMSDAQFATKIEKKMHIFIIVSNLGLYLTAMGMGNINPAVTGNACTIAAFPTGCRQYPEKFGECDPFIAKTSKIFILINLFVVPVLCLVGIVGCMAILFWNVLMTNKIFGRSRGGMRGSGISYGRGRRTQNVSSVVLDEDESDVSSSSSSSFPIPSTRTRMKSCSDIQHSRISATSTFHEEDKRSDNEHFPISIQHSSNDKNMREDNILSSDSNLQSIPHASSSSSMSTSLHHHTCSQEDGEHRQDSEEQATTRRVLPSTIDHDLEAISRLYKKELVTQACGYVAVFCTTIFMFSTLNILVVIGIDPSDSLFLTTSVLYPLGGFLNILVYTRPSVVSFLRRCPECSRLLAFWLVLKAGGEVPDENEWRDVRVRIQQWHPRSCSIFRRFFFTRNYRTNQGQHEGGRDGVSGPPTPSSGDVHVNANVHIPPRESISDVQFGISSQSIQPDESLPDSALGINGRSESIDSVDIAHRSREDWSHLEGEGSRMAVIPEGDSSALESSNEILVSQEHAVDVSSTLSSSASQKAEKQKKDDWDEMWEATFNRVKEFKP